MAAYCRINGVDGSVISGGSWADYNKRQAGLSVGEIPVDVPAAPWFPYCMELRKDPITRSWVITGDDVRGKSTY